MDRVKLSVGLTLNLGDYQSLRVDVGLERDVDERKSSVEEEFIGMREELLVQLEDGVKYFEKGTREITGRKGK